jgi:hypothetical protein
MMPVLEEKRNMVKINGAMGHSGSKRIYGG